MSAGIRRSAGLVLLALLLTGCGLLSGPTAPYSPQEWAEMYTAHLKCGMTIEEARKLAPAEMVTPQETGRTRSRPNADATYYVGAQKATSVSLSFKEGGLRWVQLKLHTGFTGVCRLREIDVCQRDRNEATAR